MKLIRGLRTKRAGKKRVVVIGIDGVPFTYVQRLFAAGELPNLRAIVDEGAMAQMDTSVPNVSSVAWASFMSGQNPGKHGIYGFVDRQPGSLKTFVPTSKNLRSPTLWEVLGKADKRVFSINVPGTYPPRPANGTVIGCFLSPSVEKAAPNAEVAADLKRLGYQIDADPWRARQDKGAFLSHLDEVFEHRMKTVRHFWNQEPWDFFMAHIMETDRLHHFFWEEMEDGHPTYAPAFLEFYRRLDAELGEIRGWLDEDTTLIVLSDHGFCSIKQEVHVNTWLQESGWLQFDSAEPKGLDAMAASSAAYSLDPGRLFLNVKGREPNGRIEPGAEYEKLRSELADAAAALTDPATGEAMVKRVFRREELYTGPFQDLGADLVLDMHDGYDPKGAFGKPDVLFKGESLTGMHTTPDALVYIAGVAAIEGRPHIADVAPTVCDLLGVPTPAEMDGRSLVSA
ncbi:MAG: alkaline phosphatase family protein [Actinomycetota bacterium]|nr:alkaline phosphatase family protein [Acidimicrobiia bacterium]MDQ3147466.1 alkaline phosphatase family protein [Actinomycetota bacterium]